MMDDLPVEETISSEEQRREYEEAQARHSRRPSGPQTCGSGLRLKRRWLLGLGCFGLNHGKCVIERTGERWRRATRDRTGKKAPPAAIRSTAKLGAPDWLKSPPLLGE